MSRPLPSKYRTCKPATKCTIASQIACKNLLPFETDKQSFADAKRGFIASLDKVLITRDNDEEPAFDLRPFDFLKEESPDTVNPSLWRQAQLTALYHGLFEVVKGHIYQVRSFDLANMTLVRGIAGWIIIDPLLSTESSRAALKLANKHLGYRKVSTVVITHSHADHFMGILGVVTREDVENGSVQIIVPKDFVQESLSENILVGPPMLRRSSYMYGFHLKPGPKGYVTSSLGPTLARGTPGFILPTDIIHKTGETRTVDGIKMIFEMTMGTEAPSEMVFYFPQFKALCMSEIIAHNMHNVYTPRGAQIRDALAWSQQIQEAIDLFGDKTEVLFTSHHWPVWGQDRIQCYMKDQCDMYKYMHDQTLRLACHGYNKEEIAEQLALPPKLAQRFYNRGYYGTLHHNVRAIYVKYLGYFDGNPANLHPLHPTTRAKQYVTFMGGADAILQRARTCFKSGDYRWVAEVVNHVVMYEPDNEEARALLADTYEQLGYQSESAPWRNFYLTGAYELREGVHIPLGQDARGAENASSIAEQMPLSNFFQSLSIRLNGAKAAEYNWHINFNFTDVPNWLIIIRNGVLHSFEGKPHPNPTVTITIVSHDFKRLLLGSITAKKLIMDRKISFKGDLRVFQKLIGLMDKFNQIFPIVTPRPRL